MDSVEAEAERMAGRVRVDPPVGPRADLVRPLQHGRAEGERPLLLSVEIVHVEVQVELLRAFLAGPFGRAVAAPPLAGQRRPLDPVHLAPAGLLRARDPPATEQTRVELRKPYRISAV